MTMPSPCELCEEIVEYDQLKVCSDCKRFVCRDCFSMGLCETCIERRETQCPDMTPTIRELVLPWYEHMTALDEAWESWRALGVNIEAPFPDAAWRIATAYTESVEARLHSLYGIDWGWLGWFLWEKPDQQSTVTFDDKSFNIATVEDLIEMLNVIAKPGEATA